MRTVHVARRIVQCDSHTRLDKQGSIHIHRSPSGPPSRASTHLLSKFVSDVDAAVIGTTIVPYPIGLDPLLVPILQFIRFCAVSDRTQVYLELYVDIQRLTIVFRDNGPFIESEDLVHISCTNEMSLWNGIDDTVRLKVEDTAMVMFLEDRDHGANDNNDELTASMSETACITQERKEVVRRGNVTITTTQRKVNTKNVKLVIKQRRVRCLQLQRDWVISNAAVTESRNRKRQRMMSTVNTTPLSCNPDKRRIQTDLREKRQQLSELDRALESVEHERLVLHHGEMAADVQEFLCDVGDVLAVVGNAQLCWQDSSELASTMAGSSAVANGVINPTLPMVPAPPPSRVCDVRLTPPEFIGLDRAICLRRIASPNALTEKELMQKEEHLRQESAELGQLYRRQIKDLETSLREFPVCDAWMETQELVRAETKRKRVRCK